MQSELILENGQTLLTTKFLDQIQNGDGAYFGNGNNVLPYIPKHRIPHTILVELGHKRPIAFNPLNTTDNHSTVATRVIESIEAVYPSSIVTTRINLNLLMGCYALLAIPNTTLFQLPYLLKSQVYRSRIINQLKDTVHADYWNDFEALTHKEKAERVESVQSRLLPLIADLDIRRVISQSKTLPQSPILIVDVPDTDRANVLAALIMSERKGYVFLERPLLHVGESTPVMSCQYLDQIPKPLMHKLLNTAMISTFKVGTVDAEILQPYFTEDNMHFNLTELTQGTYYQALHGVTTKLEFKAHGYKARTSMARRIRDRSRAKYGTPEKVVDQRIEKFLGGLCRTPTNSKRSKRKSRT